MRRESVRVCVLCTHQNHKPIKRKIKVVVEICTDNKVILGSITCHLVSSEILVSTYYYPVVMACDSVVQYIKITRMKEIAVSTDSLRKRSTSPLIRLLALIIVIALIAALFSYQMLISQRERSSRNYLSNTHNSTTQQIKDAINNTLLESAPLETRILTSQEKFTLQIKSSINKTTYNLDNDQSKLLKECEEFGSDGQVFKHPQIFFLETSGRLSLNARQACAVESAAKHHPKLSIRVLIATTTVNISDPVMAAILSLQNVHVQYLDFPSLFNDTPVEHLFTNGELSKSKYKIHHLSDISRYLILYKYGGIYFDTDVVLLKSVEKLTNFSCKESSDWVAIGAMGFERYHPLLKMCLEEASQHFSGIEWGYNGPELFTRVLLKMCGISQLNELTTENCSNVNILEPEKFYPVPWKEWKMYFDQTNASAVIKQWTNSYAIHVWNKHSEGTPVPVGSGMAYDIAARQNCPYVYEAMRFQKTF